MKNAPQGVEIPYEMLKPEILDAMLEDFVLREGTDYGHEEFTLNDKIGQVRKQLKAGKIKIFCDPGDESFDLVRV